MADQHVREGDVAKGADVEGDLEDDDRPKEGLVEIGELEGW